MNRVLRVYRSGESRAISVSKIIPKDWRVVYAEVIDRGDKYVTVKFKVLVKDE